MKGLFRLAVLCVLPNLVIASEAPPVDVEILQPQLKRQWVSTSGRLSAVERVDIRPQVGGRIEQILFVEGSEVSKGQLLLVIDPRPYQANVDRARAKLKSAEAQAVLTAAEVKRAKELLQSKSGSRSQYDLRYSEDLIAQASIAAAKADLEDAELQLDYAHIRAPITGRIGRAEITVGNVISAGSGAPILTSIVASEQVYAEFELSERDYFQLQLRSNSSDVMPVELTLGPDEKVYRGHVHAFDNSIDSRTGTIRARAIFSNNDNTKSDAQGRALLPGAFANLRIGSAETEPVLLVNQRAINTDQNKKFVYSIDANNKVVYRQIELGKVIEGYRHVLSGLDEGDRIVVKGLQRLRPEMEVTPVEVESLNKPTLADEAPAAKAELVGVAVDY